MIEICGVYGISYGRPVFSRLARPVLSITVFSFNIQVFSYEGGSNPGIHGNLI